MPLGPVLITFTVLGSRKKGFLTTRDAYVFLVNLPVLHCVEERVLQKFGRRRDATFTVNKPVDERPQGKVSLGHRS